MKKKSNKTNFIATFFDEFLLIISKVFNKIVDLDAKNLIKFMIELAIIFIFIYLFKTPFQILKELFTASINTLFPIANVITTLISIILEIIYIVFSILLFMFIYDKKYPDTKISNIKRKEYNEVFSNIFQALIIIISLPLLVSAILLFIGILLVLYLIFQGVTYFGIVLIILSLLIINILIINMVYSYINNNKQKSIYNKYAFITSMFIMAMGITLLTVEMSKTTILKGVIPNKDYIINTDNLRTKITDKTKIICDNCQKDYEVMVDNSLKDEIVIEISYFGEFVRTTFSTENNLIKIGSKEVPQFTNEDFKEHILNDLKSKQLYDYRLLFQKELRIWVNEVNKDNLDIVVK